MNDVLTMYDVKTNLSKYVKRVEAGETFIFGAYGNGTVMFSKAPEKPKIKIGVMNKKWKNIDIDSAFTREVDEAIWKDYDRKEFVL